MSKLFLFSYTLNECGSCNIKSIHLFLYRNAKFIIKAKVEGKKAILTPKRNEFQGENHGFYVPRISDFCFEILL